MSGILHSGCEIPLHSRCGSMEIELGFLRCPGEVCGGRRGVRHRCMRGARRRRGQQATRVQDRRARLVMFESHRCCAHPRGENFGGPGAGRQVISRVGSEEDLSRDPELPENCGCPRQTPFHSTELGMDGITEAGFGDSLRRPLPKVSRRVRNGARVPQHGFWGHLGRA